MTMAAGGKKDGGGSNGSNHVAPVGGGGSRASSAGSPSGSSSSAAAASSSPVSSPVSAPAGANNAGGGGGGDIYEYFAPGSVVRCLTCTKRSVEGEVMAFDAATRILILKSAASNKRSSFNDVHFVNLSLVSDVSVVQEPGASSANHGRLADPPSLNVGKLKARIQNNIDRKKLSTKAFKAGISPEGQTLFQAISKTLDQIEWDGQNIVVMNKVTIVPPYGPDNIRGQTDGRATSHVRKIIEKHREDQRRLSLEGGGGSATPAATASSSSSVPASPSIPASDASTVAAPAAGSASAAAGGTAGSNNSSGGGSPAVNANGPRLHRGLQQQQGSESGRGRGRNSPAGAGRGGGGGGGGGGSNASSPRPSYSMQ